jgi:hypothetical protein
MPKRAVSQPTPGKARERRAEERVSHQVAMGSFRLFFYSLLCLLPVFAWTRAPSGQPPSVQTEHILSGDSLIHAHELSGRAGVTRQQWEPTTRGFSSRVAYLQLGKERTRAVHESPLILRNLPMPPLAGIPRLLTERRIPPALLGTVVIHNVARAFTMGSLGFVCTA